MKRLFWVLLILLLVREAYAADPTDTPIDYLNRIQETQRLVTKDPTNLNAWIQLGNDYFDTGEAENAINAYNKALELSPDNVNVLNDVAVMYKQIHEYEKSLSTFKKSLQIDPSNQQALYNIGILYFDDLKDKENAILYLQKFIELYPKDPIADQLRDLIPVISANDDVIKKSLPSDTIPPIIITITSPDISRSVKIAAKSSSVTVTGNVASKVGVAEVTINNQPATLDEYGNFSADVLLKVGGNQIIITAMDTSRIKATETFSILRDSGKVAQPKKEDPSQATVGINTGKYYALLIAVQDYASPEINKLDFPVADAQKVKATLTSVYTFEPLNVILLVNPNRKTIFKAFQELKQKVSPQDNLLVFFAGHGVWQDDMQQGFWLPQDAAGLADPSDWIPNSTIRDYIKAIRAKHVLLVADACFAGGIFKVRDAFTRPSSSIEKIYELTSRKAITSGSIKTVPDKSVFVEYLVKRLTDNPDRYLDAQKLFVSFKEAVINNSATCQTPLYGAINEAGDEGGDFIFVRR